MLNKNHKLAILFHDQLGETDGKMGHGVLRYSTNPISCVIDIRHAGKKLHDVIDYGNNCPIVKNISDAIALGAEVVVFGIAPTGGRYNDEHLKSLDQAVKSGLSIVNGLHEPLNSRYSELSKNQWIWDIRREPDNLHVANARCEKIKNKRVLMIGTDMAIGKMTVGLEINQCALNRDIKSIFLATGQIGIMISGQGIPLDAIKVDYACGAVEKLVMSCEHHDLAIVEGQGSLLHPGSTSTLPLIRGSCPTHLILCHTAGAKTLQDDTNFIIPPLNDVIKLYEDITHCCGAFNRAKVAGIALNTSHLIKQDALDEIEKTEAATGLPTTDVVRLSADKLLDSIISET